MKRLLRRLFGRPVRPDTLAVTRVEGGDWIDFAHWQMFRQVEPNNLVHSIMFEDGTVWDAVNGWRKVSSSISPSEVRALWRDAQRFEAFCRQFGVKGNWHQHTTGSAKP